MRASATLSYLKTKGIDLLFPPLCGRCQSPVDAEGLCPACWNDLHFIAAPFCRCCGVPLPPAETGAPLCLGCIADPPAYDAARAALIYDEASRPLIHAFKYHDRQHLRPLLARWMRAAAGALLEEADFIVPVPLSRRRLFTRMFNQSALLALALDEGRHVRYAPSLLVRQRHTLPQAGLSRSERQRNLQGVFAVPAPARTRLKGKSVLLVDDVLTTGATAEACAQALKKAGAGKVSVLAIARVTRDAS